MIQKNECALRLKRRLEILIHEQVFRCVVVVIVTVFLQSPTQDGPLQPRNKEEKDEER